MFSWHLKHLFTGVLVEKFSILRFCLSSIGCYVKNKKITCIASAHEYVFCREGAPEKVGFSTYSVCQVQETGAITENGSAAVDPVTAAVFRSPHKIQGQHIHPKCHGK